jgi:hypothetical protein
MLKRKLFSFFTILSLVLFASVSIASAEMLEVTPQEMEEVLPLGYDEPCTGGCGTVYDLLVLVSWISTSIDGYWAYDSGEEYMGISYVHYYTYTQEREDITSFMDRMFGFKHIKYTRTYTTY